MFTSPAGKLAREGNAEAAYYLINKFGASIEFVVDGFLKGGLQEEANILMQKYNIKKMPLAFISSMKNQEHIGDVLIL